MQQLRAELPFIVILGSETPFLQLTYLGSHFVLHLLERLLGEVVEVRSVWRAFRCHNCRNIAILLKLHLIAPTLTTIARVLLMTVPNKIIGIQRVENATALIKLSEKPTADLGPVGRLGLVRVDRSGPQGRLGGLGRA